MFYCENVHRNLFLIDVKCCKISFRIIKPNTITNIGIIDNLNEMPMIIIEINIFMNYY